jgi:hypothetical protein
MWKGKKVREARESRAVTYRLDKSDMPSCIN